MDSMALNQYYEQCMDGLPWMMQLENVRVGMD